MREFLDVICGIDLWTAVVDMWSMRFYYVKITSLKSRFFVGGVETDRTVSQTYTAMSLWSLVYTLFFIDPLIFSCVKS